jgi:hypothetical protein
VFGGTTAETHHNLRCSAELPPKLITMKMAVLFGGRPPKHTRKGAIMSDQDFEQIHPVDAMADQIRKRAAKQGIPLADDFDQQISSARDMLDIHWSMDTEGLLTPFASRRIGPAWIVWDGTDIQRSDR